MHYSAITIMALRVERELALSQQRLEQERLLRESNSRAAMTARGRRDRFKPRQAFGQPPAARPRDVSGPLAETAEDAKPRRLAPRSAPRSGRLE